ncbi:MAG: type II toxin-antitoxin system PemK/MazF family toxin [Acidimicrobiia bacterium]
MTTPVPRRGEVWLADLAGDKVRPIVVMSPSRIARLLHSVIAAPVTSTVRDIPTEVLLSEAEGVRRHSAANFDNLQLVSRGSLIRCIGGLGDAKLAEACRSLRYAVSC